jgi:hypothetical protein
MSELAILLSRPGGVSWERQAHACMPYMDEHEYRLAGVAHSDNDAEVLARAISAPVVIAAYSGPTDRRLRALLGKAGVRLEYCREQPRADDGEIDTRELIIGLYCRGTEPSVIAEVLRVPLARVKREIRP